MVFSHCDACGKTNCPSVHKLLLSKAAKKCTILLHLALLFSFINFQFIYLIHCFILFCSFLFLFCKEHVDL